MPCQLTLVDQPRLWIGGCDCPDFNAASGIRHRKSPDSSVISPAAVTLHTLGFNTDSPPDSPCHVGTLSRPARYKNSSSHTSRYTPFTPPQNPAMHTVFILAVALCVAAFLLALFHVVPLPSPSWATSINPLEYQQRKFADWGRQYGDVVYAKLFRTPALVLNSKEAAQDLLEKKSAKYSDRPDFILLSELMGWDSVITHMPYGDRFRKHRKWIQDAFQYKRAVMSYRRIHFRETYTLLTGLLQKPEDFMAHIKRWSAGMILEITYGHRVMSLNDKYIKIAERATVETVRAGSPGSMLVDFFPILKVLPIWAPGAGFKRDALKIRGLVRTMLDTPFNMVKVAMATGTALPSFTAALLEDTLCHGSASATDEEDIKGAAGVLFGAGTDTTVTVLSTFVLAMVLHPEVYKKTQEEIDRVVGHDRLPDFDDRDALPYLECVLREVYRWNPPVPLACPGQLFADTSLWLAMANIAATLDIHKALDSSGREITPEPLFHSGFVSHPHEFICDFRPRSEKALGMVAQMSAHVDV
ncbi:O-methylsterigmatocystin oxidoreductase [Grifola frondosa]|uniref:O-methylsterigmatocystin oxidoreductase n=1 Tax=Grifola frondosa TaxID=5627 RepID=A0A1C7MDR7_GRIFR|nr:O-methylsterigmatocystin oxidoreductase [Grifola frondosa]